MVIEIEDIRGFFWNDQGQIICANCSNEDERSWKAEDIITGELLESQDGKIYFCDECGKSL